MASRRGDVKYFYSALESVHSALPQLASQPCAWPRRTGDDEEEEDATREEGRWGMQGGELEQEEAGGVKSGNPGAVEYFYSALECNHSALRVLFEMPSKKLMACPPQRTPEGGRWGVDMASAGCTPRSWEADLGGHWAALASTGCKPRCWEARAGRHSEGYWLLF